MQVRILRPGKSIDLPIDDGSTFVYDGRILDDPVRLDPSTLPSDSFILVRANEEDEQDPILTLWSMLNDDQIAEYQSTLKKDGNAFESIAREICGEQTAALKYVLANKGKLLEVLEVPRLGLYSTAPTASEISALLHPPLLEPLPPPSPSAFFDLWPENSLNKRGTHTSLQPSPGPVPGALKPSVVLTPEDQVRIDRLVARGFEREQVTFIYVVNGKDELEAAAGLARAMAPK